MKHTTLSLCALAVVAAILATAPAAAHTPERCIHLGEKFEPAWLETQEVLREVFRFVLLPPPEKPANPVPELVELMEKVEDARRAEVEVLNAFGTCLDEDE